MKKTLSEFRIGEEGVVTEIGGTGKVRRRLLDLGVTPGAKVKLEKRAPLGDPMEFELRGYLLSMRKEEASCVTAEV